MNTSNKSELEPATAAVLHILLSNIQLISF